MKRSLLFFVLIALFISGTSYAAELNIYASGLRLHGATAAEQVTGENQVHIDYFLNAPATDLKFVLLDTDGNPLQEFTIPAGTNNANYAKDLHENVVVDLSGFHGEGNTYKWAIKASADPNELAKVSDTSKRFKFYSPQGIAVDNSYESEYFGRIYVSESRTSSTSSSVTPVRSQKEGIYIFGADLTDITNQGDNSYSGGVTWDESSSYNYYSPGRISVAEDGCVFVCNNSGTNSGVWMMNPSSPSTNFKEVLDLTKRGTIFTRANSCAVTGSGDNKILYLLDNANSSTAFAIKSYPVGDCSSPYSSAGTSVVSINPNTHAIVQAMNTTVRGHNGDFWVFQWRGNTLDTYPILTHFNSSGTRDFYINNNNNSSLAPSAAPNCRGNGAVSPDGSKLAFWGNKTMYIYEVKYNNSGAPSLSSPQTITEISATNVDAIAFDVAHNIYFGSATKEWFYAYSTEKSSNTHTTPAASSRTIVLESYIQIVNVTGVTLSESSKTLKVGESFTLTPTVAPADATDKTYSWSSSDESVATISNDGVVSAIKAGTTTITVTTTDGSKTATCAVTVVNPANLEEAVENKTIRRTLMNGGKLFVLAIDGQNKPFIYKINPETSAVEAVIPTTGCTTPNDKTLACGITTLSLSDIAFTNDNVLVGINAEHMKYNSSFGTLRLYKWSDLSAAPTLWASSTNSNAVGNFTESITGAALTFVGNSATGNSQAITIAVTTGTTAEYRYVYFNLIDGEHDKTQFNRSVASGSTSDIKASTIGTDVQLHPSPLSGDFIITGSSCRPIEVIESANNVAATYNKTEAINAPTVGSCFFTEDAVKYMAIPTSAGISIYNITSGLATASLVTSVAASNTAEYRAVFAVRDEDDLILYLQKDDEISKYTEDNFFGVIINSVTLNKSETSLTVGETETLTAEVDPDDAVVTVIWESDDESVATVSDAGVVTAVSAGTTTITATAGDKSDECSVTVTAPIPMSGTYKIGGAEADYASLHAACEDINLRSLSADVTFLICANLTESQNSGLVNTTDYTLTIKPDADADRTISFANSDTDNDGPSGGFIIGDKSENVGWTATPTKNIVIDGLASDEATHKMTIKTPSTYYSYAGPIVLYGNVTNTTIKNCVITNEKTGAASSAYCVTFRNEKNTDNAPTGVIIENNLIISTTCGIGQCIYFNGQQATTANVGAPKNNIIRNNELRAAHRGIFIYGANGATIEGNVFKINKSGTAALSHGIYGLAQTGTLTVKENQFVELTTGNINDGEFGIRAITAVGGATKWIIENNFFGGLKATGSVAGKNTLLTYIACSDLCEICHNTFHMPILPKTPATVLNSTNPIACLQLIGSASHIIKNNIFVSEETTANNSLISGTLPSAVTGNIFYHHEGNAALTSSGSAIGDLDASNKWMPIAFTETYKLDFESANNSLIAVTPISGITTDIEGSTRTNPTHAGCYEPSWGLILNEESEDNADAIEAKDGQTMDVLLKRHFSVDDGLYTLVLPFDLDNEQLEEAFGVGYKLSVMQTAYFKTSDALYLKFGFVDHLEAGVPCLLRVGNDVTEDILFRDVTIDNAEPVKNVDNVVEMRGLYDMTNVPAAVTNYYLGTDDYLFRYTTAIDTKAFRSYFYFPGFATSAPPRVARVVFHEEVATDDLMIEDAPTTAAPEKIIRDGEMLIIVDGVEYDMMGRPRVR